MNVAVYRFDSSMAYEPFEPIFLDRHAPGPRRINRAAVDKRRSANRSARKARKR